MKIELNYCEITFYGFILANLFNWLDGALTYIALYIVPKGEFQEINPYVWNMFNSIGFFSHFIFKICIFLAITLFLVLVINKVKIQFKNEKSRLIYYNILYICFIFALVNFMFLVFNNALYLIKYYF